MAERKTPVTRNALFYSQEDFEFETGIFEGYIEEDTGQSVVIYEVDRTRTPNDAIYKESTDNIRFKTPREVPCLYDVQPSRLESYDGKTKNGAYAITGNLTFYVMPRTLQKYGVEISRGDYVGLLIDDGRMVHFVVTDDGKINTDNKSVIGAYKPGWRTVKCTPVTDTEFSAR